MSETIANRFYCIIGNEIREDSMDPCSYALAVERCGAGNQSGLLAEYSRIRFSRLAKNWQARRGRTTLVAFVPKVAVAGQAHWTKSVFATWLLLKMMMWLGFCGGLFAMLGYLVGHLPDLSEGSIFAGTTLCLILLPDLLISSSDTPRPKYYRWNWYGAIFMGMFSVCNAILFLKYSWYH